MAVTSYHKETGRWLTTSQGFVPGSEHCLSIGHPLNGGEFTNYRLGEVVAHNERGEPLFDLDEAEVECGHWGNRHWLTRAEIKAAVDEANSPGNYVRAFLLRGVTYQRSSFGGWRMVEAAA